MKKRVLAALLCVTLLAVMAACGGNSKKDEGAGNAVSTERASVEEETFAVGMVTDVGGVHDQSFNQSAWEGLAKLEKDYPIKASFIESQQEANYGPNLQTMADRHNNLIWAVGFMMADSVENAAKTNPSQLYAIVDNASDTAPSNLTCVVFRAQEPSFLVGYMAARTTKTNKVGFVGGISGVVIDQFEYGYRAGVAYAAKELDKEITVDVQYADSFSEDAKGKLIATRMYTDGADIVFHAAGGVGIGVINAAKEMNKLAIGVDRDQSYLAEDNVMTSAMKLVGQAMYDVSLKLYNGGDIKGILEYGVKEGACGIPDYTGSTAKLVAKADYDATKEIEKKIVDGTIKVPYNAETFAAFR